MTVTVTDGQADGWCLGFIKLFRHWSSGPRSFTVQVRSNTSHDHSITRSRHDDDDDDADLGERRRRRTEAARVACEPEEAELQVSRCCTWSKAEIHVAAMQRQPTNRYTVSHRDDDNTVSSAPFKTCIHRFTVATTNTQINTQTKQKSK